MNKEVVIVSAARTAIGSFSGTLSNFSAVDLGIFAAKEAIRRAGINSSEIDEAIIGNVLSAGLGQNIARQVAINSGLPITSPATAINILCGSGLRSVSLAAQMIDSMIHDGLTDVFNNYHMGMTAENIADQWKISREEQDAFALQSQLKCEAAQKAGKFKDEIVPIAIPQRKGDPIIFDTDEFPKHGLTIDQLAKLKSAFKKDGTVTAGNASGINDSAAMLILMLKEKADALGLKPLAKIKSYATIGLDPTIMGYGPVEASLKALKMGNMNISDIELIEANEAFAAQSIAVARDLKFNPEIVNVNGGAIALGHPIGASGARILTTLIYEMKRRRATNGLATLCISGGQGTALIIENI